jgi:phosphoribosyl 1,2-cyclic phosphate phosphodiesterase
MRLRLTLLGTGSSGGVPRIGRVWGNCDPANSKNRRRRCALLVERFGPNGARTTVLVDTPPDLREQLLDAGVERVDAVLYTHDHADHTHGIDDLRGLFFLTRRRIDMYAEAATLATLESRFAYCFRQPPGSSYPAVLNAHELRPPAAVTIAGEGGAIEAIPIPLDHGETPALGFRFGNVVYSPDLSGIPAASMPLLQGLDLWIVDALRPLPHPNHFSLKQSLDWIERLQVKRAILTHMTVELDYEALRRELPPHIEVGYDGMVIEVS